MLTKVGRTNPLLICTDCGLPVDQQQTAKLSRQRFWGAFTLLAMALLGAAMLLLASIKEMSRPEVLEGSAENSMEASAEEGGKGENSRVMEPSSLMDAPSPSRAAQSRVPEPQTRGLQMNFSGGASEPGAGQTSPPAGHPAEPTPAGPGR